MSRNRASDADYDYDVCLSFAGEDRGYVRQVADELREKGIRVFYDEYEEVDLWGKDLFQHLDDIYQNAARYCVLFVSQHYAKKLWTTHERKSAQARAIKASEEYILPAFFDGTEVPGLTSTIGHIDLSCRNPKDIAALIRKKVGKTHQTRYLPPSPDLLFERLGLQNPDEKEIVSAQAHRFLHVLGRMSEDERKVVFGIFRHGCADELPDNMHIDLDLLRREVQFPQSKVKRLVGGLQSLGFFARTRSENEERNSLGKPDMLVVEWHTMTVGEAGGNATEIAHAMLLAATEDFCADHGIEILQRLDFSQLATVTKSTDSHE